jgi:hypothetical protein
MGGAVPTGAPPLDGEGRATELRQARVCFDSAPPEVVEFERMNEWDESDESDSDGGGGSPGTAGPGVPDEEAERRELDEAAEARWAADEKAARAALRRAAEVARAIRRKHARDETTELRDARVRSVVRVTRWTQILDMDSDALKVQIEAFKVLDGMKGIAISRHERSWMWACNIGARERRSRGCATRAQVWRPRPRVGGPMGLWGLNHLLWIGRARASTLKTKKR